MITTTAALQKGVVSLDDEFEIISGVNVGGRFIENANGEYCGGTFREAFAESCNADFAPLGPEDRQRRTGRDGRTLRLQLAADALRAADRRRSRTGRIDDPDRNRRRTRPRRQRDRPGRSAGDPAGDGERRPDDRQRRRPRADLDRRQQEAAPGDEAGAGDVAEDRRRADRTDGRRGHRAAPATPARSPRPRSPARPAPPSSAPVPAKRTRNTPSSARTPGSPPSRPAEGAKLAIGRPLDRSRSRGRRSGGPSSFRGLSAALSRSERPKGRALLRPVLRDRRCRASRGGSRRRRRGATKRTREPSIGPCWGVESGAGIGS